MYQPTMSGHEYDLTY